MREKLISQQMKRARTWCELKKTFCKFSTPSFCLSPRDCPYWRAKEMSFKRRGERYGVLY